MAIETEQRIQIVLSSTQHPDTYKRFLEFQALYSCPTYPKTLDKLLDVALNGQRNLRDRILALFTIEVEHEPT